MNTIILIQSETETLNEFINRVEEKESQVNHAFTNFSKGRAEINHK